VLECGEPAAHARAMLAALLPNAAKRGFATPVWQLDPRPWFDGDTGFPIRFVAGRHFPQLDNAAQRALCGADWRIGAASNRVGYRLEGPALTLREPPQLISEGVQPGTVQLPPGGMPIVLMAEAPTCGGYPRIAQVIGVDLARLAQRRPGDSVRFAETSLEDAQTRYLLREQALTRIARYIRERWIRESLHA
jgi:antagonist of KipI